ncbi:uncharacterized protein LOC125823543 [Solanum verrucosum]|uniref:uncharacterized protein LOC125823543 n=1 Tax=Solanum verrucosum TaxID=315347 RepID=UPI0020D1923F|nr:uncharacterized protein LOC125823543 [Solanum verrucosum]
MPYHPQTSGQVEVSNWEIKSILAKTMNANMTNWSKNLDDVVLAYCTSYKTPIGMSPYRLVFGKSCHISIEIEHKAPSVFKALNLDCVNASKERVDQLNEMDKFRFKAYESSAPYKEKMKKWHDSKILRSEFRVGDFVFLSNS